MRVNRNTGVESGGHLRQHRQEAVERGQPDSQTASSSRQQQAALQQKSRQHSSSSPGSRHSRYSNPVKTANLTEYSYSGEVHDLERNPPSQPQSIPCKVGGTAEGAPTNQTSGNLVNSLVASGKVIQRSGGERSSGGDGVREALVHLPGDGETTVSRNMRIF